MNDTIDKGESTIQLVGIDPSGFVLPDGYSWNPHIVNGLKEGRVSVKDKQKRIYAVLFFCHDCLNGLCSFYENGVIQKTITFVNNVGNGWSCEYLNGKPNSFFWYKNGSKEFRLEQCKNRERLWKAFDINTNQLSSCCYYDSNHIIQGNGCVFENGVISKVGLFADGELISLVKTFSQNHMKEYDDSGNVVYEGEFLDDVEKEYPREGKGTEIRGDTCIYEGYWKNNKREGKGSSFKEGNLYYLGEWENNLPNGTGKLFDCGMDNHVVYDGIWKNGLFKVNEQEVFDYSTGEVRESLNEELSPKPIIRVSSVPKRISSSTGSRSSVPLPSPVSSSTGPIVKVPLPSLSSSEPVGRVPSSPKPISTSTGPRVSVPPRPVISSSTGPVVQLPSPPPKPISTSTGPRVSVPPRPVISSSTGPVVQLPSHPPKPISTSTGPRVSVPPHPVISSSTGPVVQLPSHPPKPISTSTGPRVSVPPHPVISSSTGPVVQLPSHPPSTILPPVPPHPVISSSTGPVVQLPSPPPSTILPPVQLPLKSRRIMPTEESVNPELSSTPVLINEEKPLSASRPKPLVPHVKLPEETSNPVPSSPCPQEGSTIELIESPKPLIPSAEPVKSSVSVSQPSHPSPSSNNHPNSIESTDGKDLRFIAEETKGGDFVVNKSIFDILITERNRDLPICVLCIMGEYRGGKSFFLNFVVRYLDALDGDRVTHSDRDEIPGWMTADGKFIDGYDLANSTDQSGFSVRGGTERNTTGILFWKKPFIIPDPKKPSGKLCVLLMDTQGLWDPETHNKLNSCIFGLSCVLSSYLIFNHKGILNSEHLSQMAMLSTFSQGLSSTEMGKAFQRIDLLCRDFANIAPKSDKTDTALKKITEWKHEVEEKPAFKPSTDKLKECFERFDVMCLPRPGFIDNKAYDGDISKINTLFMCMLGHYIESVFQQIEPRRIGGQIVTGKRFKEYAIRYGEIFKSQTTFPDSSMILDTTSEIANVEIMNECLRIFEEQMDRRTSGICSLSDDELSKCYSNSMDAAFDYFKKHAIGSATIKQSFMDKLREEMDGTFERVSTVNNEKHEKEQREAVEKYHSLAMDLYTKEMKAYLKNTLCVEASALEEADEVVKEKVINYCNRKSPNNLGLLKKVKESMMECLLEYRRKRVNMVSLRGLTVTVSKSSKFDFIDECVTAIIVADGSCNGLDECSLQRYIQLQSFKVGNYCFRDVTHLLIKNMPCLTDIIIGESSFTMCEGYCGKDIKKTFKVMDCPVLKQITIGRYSFSDFAGAFLLRNLPKLTDLTIGVSNKPSANFYHADFIIEDLPLLEKITLGQESFCYAATITINNLECLTSLVLGEYALKGAKGSSLLLSNLNSLQTIESKGLGMSFSSCTSVKMSNMLNVITLTLPSPFHAAKNTKYDHSVSKVIRAIFDADKMKAAAESIFERVLDVVVESSGQSDMNDARNRFNDLKNGSKVGMAVIDSIKGICNKMISALESDTRSMEGKYEHEKRNFKDTSEKAGVFAATAGIGALFFAPALIGVAVAGISAGASKVAKDEAKSAYLQRKSRNDDLISDLRRVRDLY